MLVGTLNMSNEKLSAMDSCIIDYVATSLLFASSVNTP